MASSQHHLLRVVDSGLQVSHQVRWQQRPIGASLPPCCPHGGMKHRKAHGVLTRAQSSEPSSQANPQQKKQQEQTTSGPSWAQPGSSEPPPWERKQAVSEPGFEIPFYAYLLTSCVVAIAAIGSIFEYSNKKPVFGVIYPDSPLYAPILGFFVIAGFPTAAFLWFKSIKLANKAARDQDREDGFLD